MLRSDDHEQSRSGGRARRRARRARAVPARRRAARRRRRGRRRARPDRAADRALRGGDRGRRRSTARPRCGSASCTPSGSRGSRSAAGPSAATTAWHELGATTASAREARARRVGAGRCRSPRPRSAAACSAKAGSTKPSTRSPRSLDHAPSIDAYETLTSDLLQDRPARPRRATSATRRASRCSATAPAIAIAARSSSGSPATSCATAGRSRDATRALPRLAAHVGVARRGQRACRARSPPSASSSSRAACGTSATPTSAVDLVLEATELAPDAPYDVQRRRRVPARGRQAGRRARRRPPRPARRRARRARQGLHVPVGARRRAPPRRRRAIARSSRLPREPPRRPVVRAARRGGDRPARARARCAPPRRPAPRQAELAFYGARSVSIPRRAIRRPRASCSSDVVDAQPRDGRRVRPRAAVPDDAVIDRVDLARSRRGPAPSSRVGGAARSRLARLAGCGRGRSRTRRARVLALFVAGADVARDVDAAARRARRARRRRRRVATRASRSCRSRAPALIVCDRLDAPATRAPCAGPTTRAITSRARSRRAARDAGSTSAAARRSRRSSGPSSRTGSSRSTSTRARVRYARLGARLSGIARLEPLRRRRSRRPMPGAVRAGHVQRADPGRGRAPQRGRCGVDRRATSSRAWSRARAALLAPGGLVVVHAALMRSPATLAGERVIVAYTPADDVARVRGRVVAARCRAPPRSARAARYRDRPHLDHADRDAASRGRSDRFVLPSQLGVGLARVYPRRRRRARGVQLAARRARGARAAASIRRGCRTSQHAQIALRRVPHDGHAPRQRRSQAVRQLPPRGVPRPARARSARSATREVTPPRRSPRRSSRIPIEDIWQAEPPRFSHAPTSTPARIERAVGFHVTLRRLPRPRRQARAPRSRDVRALPRARGEPARRLVTMDRVRRLPRGDAAAAHARAADPRRPALRSREPPRRSPRPADPLRAVPRRRRAPATATRSRRAARSRAASAATTTAIARPTQLRMRVCETCHAGRDADADDARAAQPPAGDRAPARSHDRVPPRSRRGRRARQRRAARRATRRCRATRATPATSAIRRCGPPITASRSASSITAPRRPPIAIAARAATSSSSAPRATRSGRARTASPARSPARSRGRSRARTCASCLTCHVRAARRAAAPAATAAPSERRNDDARRVVLVARARARPARASPIRRPRARRTSRPRSCACGRDSRSPRARRSRRPRRWPPCRRRAARIRRPRPTSRAHGPRPPRAGLGAGQPRLRRRRRAAAGKPTLGGTAPRPTHDFATDPRVRLRRGLPQHARRRRSTACRRTSPAGSSSSRTTQTYDPTAGRRRRAGAATDRDLVRSQRVRAARGVGRGQGLPAAADLAPLRVRAGEHYVYGPWVMHLYGANAAWDGKLLHATAYAGSSRPRLHARSAVPSPRAGDRRRLVARSTCATSRRPCRSRSARRALALTQGTNTDAVEPQRRSSSTGGRGRDFARDRPGARARRQARQRAPPAPRALHEVTNLVLDVTHRREHRLAVGSDRARRPIRSRRGATSISARCCRSCSIVGARRHADRREHRRLRCAARSRRDLDDRHDSQTAYTPSYVEGGGALEVRVAPHDRASARACCRGRPSVDDPIVAEILDHPNAADPIPDNAARQLGERGFTEIGTTARMSLGARKFSLLVEVYGRRTRYALDYCAIADGDCPSAVDTGIDDGRVSRRWPGPDRRVDRPAPAAVRELRAVERARFRAGDHRLQEPPADDGGRVLGALVSCIVARAALASRAPTSRARPRSASITRLHERNVDVSGAEPIACTRCHVDKAGRLVGRPGHAACFGACHGAAPAPPSAAASSRSTTTA